VPGGGAALAGIELTPTTLPAANIATHSNRPRTAASHIE
jgi:hypothetical protein